MERLLSLKDIAARVNLAYKTLTNWRVLGKLPPPVGMPGPPRWRPAVIEAWIDRGMPAQRVRLPRPRRKAPADAPAEVQEGGGAADTKKAKPGKGGKAN